MTWMVWQRVLRNQYWPEKLGHVCLQTSLVLKNRKPNKISKKKNQVQKTLFIDKNTFIKAELLLLKLIQIFA